MALSKTSWATAPLLSKFLAVFAILLAVIFVLVVHRLRFHRLSHIPGPFVAKISPVFLYTICYLGIEGRVLRKYHERLNTKVLRVAPNSVSISDPHAVHDIYIAGGGFPKDARYQNFNLGPVRSIFSAINPSYRDHRAKAVAPLFVSQRLRAASKPDGSIGSSIADFITKLRACKTASVRTDLLDLCARLSIDIVTGTLLGEKYNGLHEYTTTSPQGWQTEKLSANPFIFAIVRFSRFSLLPNRLFKLVYTISSRIASSEKVTRSFLLLDDFTKKVMDAAQQAKDPSSSADFSTYPSRLLRAGISPAEAAAQSKAIVFAGADSTAVMLVTALFHLIRNPTMRQRLENDLAAAAAAGGTSTDPPYLHAVIKEVLRLGMANPTRLTRIIPPSTTLRVAGYTLPAGTIVGCAAYTLHHDPDTFPEPFSFRPERWLSLSEGDEAGLRRPGMERSILAFGAGSRACLGKGLAMQQLLESVRAVVGSGVLEGARTVKERIEVVEWFNGEIVGHEVGVEWVGVT
ncbi:MAG: hypothetical protein Q9219_001697 [cf. Caloplaca sp. 3 TL-2023]